MRGAHPPAEARVTVRISPVARQQFFDNQGRVAAGMKLFTYLAGSTTKQATFTNSGAGAQNTNPIVLNSAGRTPNGLWLTDGILYKLVLAPENDTDPPTSAVWSEDNIGTGDVTAADLAALSASLAGSGGSALVGFLQAGTGPITTQTVQQKLRWLEVCVAEWGVLPSASAAVNGAGLMAMNADLRALNMPVRILFPRSSTMYQYDRIEWLKGLRNVIVDAWGCKFKNTMVAPSYDAQGNQLMTNWNPFTPLGPGQVYSGASTTFGNLINTAATGDTSVTTTTASDAGNFSADNRVLIYGWGQQDASFPPNPRYFEWNEVSTVNAGTGQITLKRKLRYEYDSRWHDFNPGKGAPRIISLDNSNFTWGDYFEWNGGEFLENTGHTINNVQVEGFKTAVLNGVRGTGFVPSICERVEANGCLFKTCEIDKIMDTVVLNGGEIEQLSAATGVNVLHLIGGIKITDTLEFAAHSTIVDDAVLTCSGNGSTTTAIAANVAYAQREIDIRRARVSPKTATVTALINGGAEKTFTIASVSSNTKVLISSADDATAEPIFQSLHVGWLYQLQDGSKRVRITKIYREDASNIAIEGEFSSIPLVAEIYRACNINSIRIGNVDYAGNLAAAFRQFNFPRAQRMRDEEKDGRHFYLSFSEKDLTRQASGAAFQNNDWYVRARLIRLWAFIDLAYSGGTANVRLFLKGVNASATTYASVNVSTTGAREVTAFTSSGAVAGDTLTATAGDFCEQFRINLGTGGGVFPAYADPVELPKFRVIAQFLQA